MRPSAFGPEKVWHLQGLLQGTCVQGRDSRYKEGILVIFEKEPDTVRSDEVARYGIGIRLV